MTETNHNLYAALRAAFPADLDAIAIETAGGADPALRYSWRDLDEASAMLASLLGGLALAPGSRIAVQVEKSVETLVLYLATLRSGHVFVPLNTAYQSAEIQYFLENAEPAVVVCSPANFGWVSKIAFVAGTRHVFTLDDQRGGSLLQRAAHQPRVHQSVESAADDLAVIIYTSGTTGRSKGAMLTHGNLISNARTLRDYWQWQPDDVLIHALPIFHVHGLFVAIHGALINASPMLWLNRFDAATVIGLLSRATVFMGVPMLYVRMLAEPLLTPSQVARMRLFISGSTPLLIDTFQTWQTRTGHTILERYGMSETTMLTSNPCGPDPRHGGADERVGGTVGFPLPGVDLRVVDDTGQSVAAGEVGGIEVRGPNVFQCYWRMLDKTAEAFSADGFFKTGDVGQVDACGYVTIVGRSKDLIISGSHNVYPAEIEGQINDMPGVAESAVVGVPHPDFGEVGVAVVIAEPGAKVDPKQVIASLKTRLANFKIPKRCVVVSELPRNTMGKVQKNLLREQYKNAFV
jgi:malonyl-CoA/methylmalonyl-CoA synthetase